MTELADITRVLDQLKPFTPIQRVLLACTGTLQGTLSAYFGEPVEVEVLNQFSNKIGYFSRRVRLVTPSNNVSVCLAYTSVFTNSPEVIELIEAQQLGLGQILQKLGLKATFTLVRASQGDYRNFWRDYRLEASVDGYPTVSYEIKETFPKELYT